MKRVLLCLFTLLVLLSTRTIGQIDPDVINFEAGSFGGVTFNPFEGQAIVNSDFSAVYGVTFHIGSLGSTTVPYIAEVGGSTNFAFVGPSGAAYTSANCTVAAGVTRDKPTNTLDVGCFFLTDDNKGVTTNPKSLYVDYQRECSQASGYLLDVDGKPDGHPDEDWQEGWRITAFPTNPNAPSQSVFVLSPNYTLYPPMAGLTNFSTLSGDGEPSYWEIDLGTETIDYIEFDYIGSPEAFVGIAFDEFYLCSSALEDNSGCCEGTNLIPNGSFEAGNNGFGSSYAYTSNISPNSVGPGRYGILNTAQAQTVSLQWNAFNHTNCQETGNFMAINGKTMGSAYGEVYSQTDIPVDPEKEYVFCYYYRRLEQCAFDVWDPRNLVPSFINANATLNECDSDDELCGWTKVSYTLVPEGNLISILLFLDENPIGDGNDFALDDISLKEKLEMPVGYHDFDINSSSSGNTFTMTGTATTSTLPTGFDVTWRAVELDCNSGSPIPGTAQVWTTSPFFTNFPGYCCNNNGTSAGIFSKNKCYQVTRTVSNCCYKDGISGWNYESFNALRMPGVSEAESATGMFMSKDGKNWIPMPSEEQTELEKKASSFDQIRIFPNPGDGHVTLESRLPMGKVDVQVSNSQGKVLSNVTVETDGYNIELNLSKLPAGVYLIRLASENGLIRQEKYVKQ